MLSSESTPPYQSTRSAMWTFDSTHGATHSGSDLIEKHPPAISNFPIHGPLVHVPLNPKEKLVEKNIKLYSDVENPDKLVIRSPPLTGYQVTTLKHLYSY